ncbi:RNA-binding protein CP33, chloroplastic [Linum perenne]
MAAALHPALLLFSVNDPIQSLPRTSHSALSFKHYYTPNSTGYLHLRTSSPVYPLTASTDRKRFCVAQETEVLEKETEQSQEAENHKRKLFVLNLSWALSVAEVKELFGQCGTVTDVEFIKRDNGKSKGYAFVTMASGAEAQAAMDKFHSKDLSELCGNRTVDDLSLTYETVKGMSFYNLMVVMQEVSGRVVTVEFANGFRRKRETPSSEASHKLYVSNLAWKARGSHLKEFFSAGFKPVTSRVVFENSPGGRSAGYGFVSFETKEEAEAAIAALDGKELMGRPVRLKFSDPKGTGKGQRIESQTKETENSEEVNDSESQTQETENSEEANESEIQTQETDQVLEEADR